MMTQSFRLSLLTMTGSCVRPASIILGTRLLAPVAKFLHHTDPISSVRLPRSETGNARNGLLPRLRFRRKHVARDKLERIKVIHERLGVRRDLERRVRSGVSSRAVEVVVGGREGREGLRAVNLAERVDEDRKLVVRCCSVRCGDFLYRVGSAVDARRENGRTYVPEGVGA